MPRDGMHQTAAPTGLAPYRPNSLDGGQPLVADAARRRLRPDRPPGRGSSGQGEPVSFDDHFSQAAMFYRSLTPLEQAHIVEAGSPPEDVTLSPALSQVVTEPGPIAGRKIGPHPVPGRPCLLPSPP
jgi:catalase